MVCRHLGFPFYFYFLFFYLPKFIIFFFIVVQLQLSVFSPHPSTPPQPNPPLPFLNGSFFSIFTQLWPIRFLPGTDKYVQMRDLLCLSPLNVPPGTWEPTFLSLVQFSDSEVIKSTPFFSPFQLHASPRGAPHAEYGPPSPSSMHMHLLAALCWPRLGLKFAHISSVVQVGKGIWKRPGHP